MRKHLGYVEKSFSPESSGMFSLLYLDEAAQVDDVDDEADDDEADDDEAEDDVVTLWLLSMKTSRFRPESKLKRGLIENEACFLPPFSAPVTHARVRARTHTCAHTHAEAASAHESNQRQNARFPTHLTLTPEQQIIFFPLTKMAFCNGPGEREDGK